MKDVRVAAAQMYGIPCKNSKNVDTIEKLTAKAAKNKAKMILFPEMAITGFDYDKKLRPVYDASEPVPNGPSTKRLIEISQEYDMYIFAGIGEKGEGELCYNSCIVTGPEGYIGKYRKVHMNSERWLYTESNDFPIFNTRYGNVGVNICYDNCFLESARILALKGAEILMAPHCVGKLKTKSLKGLSSNAAKVKKFLNHYFLRFMTARANDNDLYVVMSNMWGGSHQYIGASFILDPKGDVIASNKQYKEDIVYADLKASVLQNKRASQTCTLKRRHPASYGEISM